MERRKIVVCMYVHRVVDTGGGGGIFGPKRTPREINDFSSTSCLSVASCCEYYHRARNARLLEMLVYVISIPALCMNYFFEYTML